MGSREQFWQAHVDACRVSGIIQKAYCERNGITPKTYRIWRTRLAGAVCATPTEGEPHGGEVKGRAKEFCCKDCSGPWMAPQAASHAATSNSLAVKTVCARISRPPVLPTCPFLTIAIIS